MLPVDSKYGPWPMSGESSFEFIPSRYFKPRPRDLFNVPLAWIVPPMPRRIFS